MNLNLDNIHKVVCLGIGGGDLSYISKFLFYLDIEVEGFDIAVNERIKELERLGVNIHHRNPEGKLPQTDLVIYSDALPDNLLQELKRENEGVRFIEVGRIKRFLADAYESNTLTKKQLQAIKKADIFPLYSFKPRGMKLIGVTGTDGKTTVVSMLHHMLLKSGFRPAMISTVGSKIVRKHTSTGLHVTTPSSHEIYESLLLMQKRKCTHVIIECTSQGLYMGRVAGLKFDVAVYTNITRDHLKYHKTWNNYALAKSLLITQNLKKGGYVVLNKDDAKSFNFLTEFTSKYISYTTSKHNTDTNAVKAYNIKESPEGISFMIDSKKYVIPVIGKYNVSNALAAISTLRVLGVDDKNMNTLLKDFSSVQGRMNVLQKEPFMIIVDFAHTPNALKSALESASKLKKKNSKIILVFGCASKRDDYKRPIMGEYAKKYADITILTAEDCRMESLKKINDEIEKGWKEYQTNEKRQLIRFDDDTHNIKVRRDAIKKAISLASSGDIVLITGKGHERSLCFGLKEYEWSDIAEIKKLIRR